MGHGGKGSYETGDSGDWSIRQATVRGPPTASIELEAPLSPTQPATEKAEVFDPWLSQPTARGSSHACRGPPHTPSKHIAKMCVPRAGRAARRSCLLRRCSICRSSRWCGRRGGRRAWQEDGSRLLPCVSGPGPDHHGCHTATGQPSSRAVLRCTHHGGRGTDPALVGCACRTEGSPLIEAISNGSARGGWPVIQSFFATMRSGMRLSDE